MKLTKVLTLGAAAALALSLAACGASSSVAASTAASSAAASSVAASSAAASSEAAASSVLTGEQTATYTLYNTTGDTIKELYFYENGADKGENLAGDGMADGATLEVVQKADASVMDSKVYTIEFVAADGNTYTFDTLHFETVPVSLLSADAAAGATPIAFSEPQA
jgi:hypothetical protein